jgi:hypothetical protein
VVTAAPDYDDEELATVFEVIARGHQYRIDDELRVAVREWFSSQARGPMFGNARLARNLFEECAARQATRLGDVREPTDAQLVSLLTADLPCVGVREL